MNPATFVYLNNEFVPAARAAVSVFDRGFLLGDGLFETVAVYRGKPFRWDDHWRRLERGAELLEIGLPLCGAEARDATRTLVEKNLMPEALLRITLSRGAGPRGYSPREAKNPTFLMALHPGAPLSANPVQWRLVTSSYRAATDKLASVKHCSKLHHVLARAEADAAGADEALLLNDAGRVGETASANVFCVRGEAVLTPPLSDGALPGITREVVLEICRSLGIRCCENSIAESELAAAEGVFLTLTSLGVVEVIALNGGPVARSRVVSRIAQRYYETVTMPTE